MRRAAPIACRVFRRRVPHRPPQIRKTIKLLASKKTGQGPTNMADPQNNCALIWRARKSTAHRLRHGRKGEWEATGRRIRFDQDSAIEATMAFMVPTVGLGLLNNRANEEKGPSWFLRAKTGGE